MKGLLGGSRRHQMGLGGLGYKNLLTGAFPPPHTHPATPCQHRPLTLTVEPLEKQRWFSRCSACQALEHLELQTMTDSLKRGLK